MESHFHKAAQEAARLFLENVLVDAQINKYQNVIQENRKIITSIISYIVFCGSRENHYGDGIVEDLFKLKIDAGDNVLKKHMEHGKGNASYRSVEIQNEIISLCGEVLREKKKKRLYN